MKGIWATLDPFIEGGAVMGRKSANAGFLRALLSRDPFDGYHFFLAEDSRRRDLEVFLEREFPELRSRVCLARRTDLPQALAKGGYRVFHLSDCINSPADLARLRNLFSPEIFPITSLTHSLSRSEYPAAFLAHFWPGRTSREATVATSRAGAGVVRRIYTGLAEDYGLTGLPPRVEIIPLGVDTEHFRPATPGVREEMRRRLGFGPECVILILGRISRHSKMDLLPLARILDRMTGLGQDPTGLRFVLAGWAEGEEEFAGAVTGLLRRGGAAAEVRANVEESAKLELLQAADILLSPSDNPQETFGLTLLEAGACGLPVVASDYDGYRDILADGATGFLVRTSAPAATPLIDALAPLVYDSQYHLLLGQTTAVSVPDCALALTALAADPSLRQSMGAAARQRVEERFAWPVVIEAWLELWDSLSREPLDGAEVARLSEQLQPLRLEYGRVFAGHPGHRLGEAGTTGSVLRQSVAGAAVYRGQDPQVIYPGLHCLFGHEDLRRLLFLARAPVAAQVLAERLRAARPELGPDVVWAMLAFALKHDLLEEVRDGHV